VLSVLRVWRSTACTLDWSFWRKNEGKSDGFDLVKMTFAPVSEAIVC
jgi:hypothetical protein